MLSRLCIVIALLAASWATAPSAGELTAEEMERHYAEGYSATKLRCQVVARELRDHWLYYDDFRIYRMSFSIGDGIVNSYDCTISAKYTSPPHRVREVDVYIQQRIDSAKLQYKVAPSDADTGVFPGCRLETLLDCMKEQEGRR